MNTLYHIVSLIHTRLASIGVLWWLILAAILILEYLICCHMFSKKLGYSIKLYLFFLNYYLFVIISTVLSRAVLSEEYLIKQISFDISTAWTFGPGLYGAIDNRFELILNILMFVPFGYLLMKLSQTTWITLLVSLLITLIIETLQLVTRRGFFELADILLNFIGGVLGWLICIQLQKRKSDSE